jgi:hypothetical protein
MKAEQLTRTTTDQKVGDSNSSGITKGNKAGKPKHPPLPKQGRLYKTGRNSTSLYKTANQSTNRNGLGVSQQN